MQAASIPTAIYYLKPLHLQEAFDFLGYREGSFPVSEEVAKRIFSLPMHPYLKLEDQERIINVLVAAPLKTQRPKDSKTQRPNDSKA